MTRGGTEEVVNLLCSGCALNLHVFEAREWATVALLTFRFLAFSRQNYEVSVSVYLRS